MGNRRVANVSFCNSRIVFNTNKDNATETLIFRPEGIVPNSEDDTHQVVALTNSSYEGVSVTPYGKIGMSF